MILAAASIAVAYWYICVFGLLVPQLLALQRLSSPVLCLSCCRAAELRRCCCLRELHLEHNRLVTPLLDLTHATALASLQVSPGGNSSASVLFCTTLELSSTLNSPQQLK
jgi:hypothetical protein